MDYRSDIKNIYILNHIGTTINMGEFLFSSDVRKGFLAITQYSETIRD